MWPDRRILDLLHIDVPILLAPMAGPGLAELAIAVAQAGGLGSLPTALLSADQLRVEIAKFRAGAGARPINLNFFCHTPPVPDPARDAAWRERLAPYYRELGLDPSTPIKPGARAPFDDALCRLVEELRPEVVSFHFGLPEPALLDRVRATGAVVVGSATTVAEARWLDAHGCDAIIAQGAEAGGHRGVFLGGDPIAACATQPGTMALVPQVVDAVTRPVIAAGGIADGRGIVAAMALGAAAVQIGTAYLFCPEAKVAPLHRAALRGATDDGTTMTNVFTGRPARGIVNRAIRELGPLTGEAPAFPLAGGALAPLKAQAEARGSGDFSSLWAGQAAALGRELPAAELTRAIAEDALARLARRG
ncbi:MAG TPA: nitronate monooxygenase family protein [Kofleriaceae bacterium]|jgi:nitronate monooxygenase|nr:nitronate monooxygenase family protein [Kofleriaceae bacterium]